jgi:hypothetical protein
MSLSRILFLAFAALFLFSCQKAKKNESVKATDGGYFSVTMFAKDQVNTYWGQPFTLEKIEVINGKRDSSIVSAFKLDWASVLKPFFQSDISDPRFADKYNFSSFHDNTTSSTTYFYEAKENDLFTRNLQVVTDAYSNKIKSIYIETAENGRFSSKAQKLFYSPIKVIQIQEFQSSLIGKDKNIRTEYRFLY